MPDDNKVAPDVLDTVNTEENVGVGERAGTSVSLKDKLKKIAESSGGTTGPLDETLRNKNLEPLPGDNPPTPRDPNKPLNKEESIMGLPGRPTTASDTIGKTINTPQSGSVPSEISPGGVVHTKDRIENKRIDVNEPNPDQRLYNGKTLQENRYELDQILQSGSTTQSENHPFPHGSPNRGGRYLNEKNHERALELERAIFSLEHS